MKRLGVAALILLAGCQPTEPSEPIELSNLETEADNTADLIHAPEAKPAPTSVPEGVQISVESDPNAQYWLIKTAPMSNGHVEAITRRVGPSGESFARREIDCRAGAVRYIGEGDTLAEALQDSPEPGDLGVPLPMSITGEVTAFVCERS